MGIGDSGTSSRRVQELLTNFYAANFDAAATATQVSEEVVVEAGPGKGAWAWMQAENVLVETTTAGGMKRRDTLGARRRSGQALASVAGRINSYRP
jgi:hypothetical protein